MSVPGRVLSIDGSQATVDALGVRRTLRLELAEEPVAVGDFVVHSMGYVLRPIPAEEAQQALSLFEAVLHFSPP